MASCPGHTYRKIRIPLLRIRSAGRFLLCAFLLLAFTLQPLPATALEDFAALLEPAPDPYTDLGIEHSATAAIVIEIGRGMELYAKEADKSVHIPALSKVMTAILVLQRFPADTYVTVSLLAEETNSAAVPKSHLDGFAAGDKFTVEFLVASMFYIDSDAAAIALAELHSGSESAFAGIMNERAGQLELFDTVFLNSTGRAVAGSDEPDGEPDTQYPVTTPRDAAKLVRYFLQSDNYERTVNTAFRTSSTRFFPTTDARSIEITNNLAYAWTYVDYLSGLFASDDSGTVSLLATFAAGGFETLSILVDVAPGEEIIDLQQLSGGIYRNYVNTVLVRSGQSVPETIRDSVEGTVFGLRYKRTVYYVQRIGSAAVTDEMQYTSAGPHTLPLMEEDTVGTMTFTLPNGTKITVECAPDRTIYSVDSGFANKMLNAFKNNPDLYIIIMICTGAVVLAALYKTGSGLVRLYWRLRLRKAERALGSAEALSGQDGDDRHTA